MIVVETIEQSSDLLEVLPCWSVFECTAFVERAFDEIRWLAEECWVHCEYVSPWVPLAPTT